jgi:ABC-type branched-subunit amino acid transport system substrate-binding protein
MVLKIPIIEQGEFKAKDEFFIYHQVKNGENINTISQFYNVQISEIAEFNDINNIISGQILAIPTKTLSQEQIFIIKNNKPLLPDFINIDPNYFEDPKYPPCSKFVYNDTMTFKIAIVLPFYATQNYSYSLNAASSKSGISFYKNTQVFFNFLQGVLLAVDKLKSEGYNLKIFVYDTQGDSTILNSIFNRYEMTKMDLIIGPAYSSNYSIVEDFCSKNKINIVSPLTTHNTVIDSNGFVFKIMPGYEQLTLFAAQHFTQYADTSLIAVINNETPKQQSLADSLHQSLLMLADNPTNLNFKKINFSKFVTPYQNNLDKQKFNIVFITSTDEVEVSAILNNLNSLVVVSKYKIRVYCLPSVANFTKLQIEWLSNLNLHFISSTYINPESVDIKEFENKYTKMFGAKSTMYSHIGYDVMYYFVTALKMYGKYFQFCINQNQEFMSKGTFMNFEFYRHNKTGGFENHGLFMLFYDKDLNIKLETNPELKYIDMIK